MISPKKNSSSKYFYNQILIKNAKKLFIYFLSNPCAFACAKNLVTTRRRLSLMFKAHHSTTPCTKIPLAYPRKYINNSILIYKGNNHRSNYLKGKGCLFHVFYMGKLSVYYQRITITTKSPICFKDLSLENRLQW